MTVENLLSPGQHPGIEVSVETGLAQIDGTAYPNEHVQQLEEQFTELQAFFGEQLPPMTLQAAFATA